MCYCSLLSSNAFPLSRFNPMSRGELTNLQVSVSILCHFEDGADWTDWVVGTHGIRIEWFSERGNRKTATYLLEVPLAQMACPVHFTNSFKLSGLKFYLMSSMNP